MRLARNHPLPDGNKRVAWIALRLFVDINGWTWNTRPSTDEAETTVLAVAAGELDERATADWIRQHLTTRDSS